MSSILGWLCLASTSSAFAAPDRVAASWTVASPTEWAWADTGQSVGIIGDSFTFLDLGTWTTTTVAVCSEGGSPRGLASGTITVDGVSMDTFWVGCGDGSVQRVDVEDGSPVLSSDVLTAGTTAVTAVDYDGTDLLVVMQGSNGLAEVTALSPDDASVVSGYPTTLAYDALNDSLLLNGSLYVVHGNDHISRITTSNAAVYLTTQATGANYQTATGSTAGLVYLTDKTGGDIWLFDTGSDTFSLVVSDVGTEATSLALAEDEGWAAISADTDLAFFDFASGSFGSEFARIAGVGAFSRLGTLAEPAGGPPTLLALSEADSVVDVLAEGPWVEITSAPSTAGAAATALSIDFSSDIAGDWTLWLGDTLSNASEIDSGTIAAGDTVTVSTTVDDAWIEGRNRLWLTVDDGSAIGHDAVDIDVDTPPAQPDITVGFGESTLNVQIAAVDTEDLDHYEIYLSDAAFSAADFETGGPAFETTDVSAPVELDATPGSAGSYTFYPLTNGTTYWAAVRAVDSGGLESEMSEVLSATPSYTYSASELRGDDGGFSCSSAPGAVRSDTLGIAGLIVSAGVALAGLRRRASRILG